MLTAHGLHGTFFINSGNVGKTGYLTLPQLDAIAAATTRSAGTPLDHPDLATLSLQEVRDQICEDRNKLIGWGFPVRNFAYPFASASPGHRGDRARVRLQQRAQPGRAEDLPRPRERRA